MAIKYYPNRVFRALPTPVDALMQKDTVKSFKGVQDIAATAIDDTLSPMKDWKVVGIKFTFDSGAARDYYVNIIGGRSVLFNLNDFLWFQSSQSLPQRITLTPGFYTGTELAAELKTQLDANTAFTDLGITFTVAYTADGEYVITPSAGDLRYLELNASSTISYRYSIAGHLFGFNTNTDFLSALTSDTPVPGLDSSSVIIEEVAGTDLSHYNNDIHTLSLDEAIQVTTNVAGVVVNYSVDYQEILV